MTEEKLDYTKSINGNVGTRHCTIECQGRIYLNNSIINILYKNTSYWHIYYTLSINEKLKQNYKVYLYSF